MKSRTLALALATVTLAAMPVLAQTAAPQLPGIADPSRVSAGTYAADPNHTLVGWRVDHFGFSDYFGLFGDVSGTLEFDPATPSTAKLDVTIPIASVTVASSGLKDHLLRAGTDGAKPDFFGPEPAPAHFVSTMVTPTGPTTAQIVGNLTLNGVTAPVMIAARFTGAGANPMSKAETVGFEGRAMLKRSTFGVSAFVPFVSDEVELDITAAFEKK
ncbi:polyisoprenoid-binding protein [Croceicoccus ponticola]|uniref:Polyisoprenoid-binding protein n=1 Tax=Croceicoccus ponticola TaxID=2217664 RepID=A0A437H161_9SPHN|nr:YceI family protein [Croceicoccus ponticola]RVQ69242.1 polyisoprenoid-binding protein [Croceicoccus ponticola]